MRCLDITGAVIGYNDLRDLKKNHVQRILPLGAPCEVLHLCI